MSKTKYIIDPAYLAKFGGGFTVVIREGQPPKRVALHGEIKVTIPPSGQGPGQEILYLTPNQADLENLFKAGHPAIIKAADKGDDE